VSNQTVSSSGAGTGIEHSVAVPGGRIYYRTEGSGPPLVLIGGGPSNADTLSALARELGPICTAITYDRRGYSRSTLTDPSQPASISLHADDVRHIIDDVGAGPASVFATSVGALIGLELTAAHPDSVARVIVHEPPLGQFVPSDSAAAFDVALDPDDAGAALDQIAESIGITRGRSLADSPDRPEVLHDDIELFIRRDVPAISEYHLNLPRIIPLAARIAVTAGEEGREFYPHRCAEALAAALGRPVPPDSRRYPVTRYNRRMAQRVARRADLSEDAVAVAFTFNNLATMLIFGVVEDIARFIPLIGSTVELAVGLLGFYFHRIVLVTDDNIYVYRDLPFHIPGRLLVSYRRGPGVVRIGTDSPSWFSRVIRRGQLTFEGGTIVYHAILWIRRAQYVAQEGNTSPAH
jgi:pimeloyl-ACP methyl ester carboxylesterase